MRAGAGMRRVHRKSLIRCRSMASPSSSGIIVAPKAVDYRDAACRRSRNEGDERRQRRSATATGRLGVAKPTALLNNRSRCRHLELAAGMR